MSSQDSSGNYMNEKQLCQPINFSPPKIANSPKKPSPLRQCLRVASIPDLDLEDDDVPSLHDFDSATYLQDLRNNRVARLNGSRPPPPSRIASKRQPNLPTSSVESLPSPEHHPAPRPTHTRARSLEPNTLRTDFTGRPLVTRPLSSRNFKQPSPLPPDLGRDPPGATYVENGQRRVEKQDVHSLRTALEDLDLEEEQRIHSAAQDEAAELVWKHRTGKSDEKTPTTAYKNPDADPKVHNSQRSVDRSHSRPSTAPQSSEVPTTLADPFVEHSPVPKVRSAQSKGKSYEHLANAVATDVAVSKRRVSSGSKRRHSVDTKSGFMSPNDKIFEEPDDQLKGARVTGAVKAADKVEEKTDEVPRHVRRNPFARVRQAQEKFEKKESPSGYSVKKDDRNESVSGYTARRHERIEIQRNPPSQSRNAFYTVNDSAPSPPKPKPEEVAVEEEPEEIPTKEGKEIRGDDIVAATSMRRKDRSPNLPQPTAVSDSPGRPIVSFHSGWKPEIELVEAHSPDLPDCLAVGKSGPSDQALSGKQRRYSLPRSSQGAPPIPSIAFPDDLPTRAAELPGSTPAISELAAGVPTIVVPDDPSLRPSRTLPEQPNIPEIVVPGDVTDRPPNPAIRVGGKQPPPPLHHRPQSEPSPPMSSSAFSRRPLPNPTPSASSRPLPVASKTSPYPAAAKPHMTPSVRRTTALCAHCALPIAGRILSAAGERFHPSCFKCHHCGINLECVAFYPEPEKKRAERLARIQQRQQGLEMQIPEGVTAEDVRRLEEQDGDESLRFFCGLDFHEFFSPRCKSCKTPIEGEVIVACGGEWHVGHFFCAQCGDPFDSSTPFVEKEGYAWCVGCHTNRYSAKCRKCRKPVTDVVVKALGAEWHSECFCCTECGDGFDDGRYFLRGHARDPVCVKCEDRRLKA